MARLEELKKELNSTYNVEGTHVIHLQCILVKKMLAKLNSCTTGSLLKT